MRSTHNVTSDLPTDDNGGLVVGVLRVLVVGVLRVLVVGVLRVLVVGVLRVLVVGVLRVVGDVELSEVVGGTLWG